jgi:protein SCO1/2
MKSAFSRQQSHATAPSGRERPACLVGKPAEAGWVSGTVSAPSGRFTGLSEGQAVRSRPAAGHAWWLAACLLLSPVATLAQGASSGPWVNPQDQMLKKVRLDQKLDAQVPLDLSFRDETGKKVVLRQYFGHKPVLINLIQYRCTQLCSEEMKVLAQTLKQMPFTVGDQFNVLTVSIDSREQPELAAQYQSGYLREYGRPPAKGGWHFLTGEEASIRRLADSIGYHFVYDARTDQFAHPDGVIVLTPDGHVARYFFRLQYPPRDIRFALIEASHFKIGSLLDGFALTCFHYNPLTGKYSLSILGLLRMAALATVLLLATGIAVMSWRSRQAKPRADHATLTREG